MIKRLAREQIRSITSMKVEDISDHDRDEMAIPSYLHINPLIRWLMWKRYDQVAAIMDERNRTALEFGCGIGLFLGELCKRCEKVYAIDLFPQYAMENCRQQGLEVTFAEDIEAIEDGSIDVIVAADVLEHITELDACLERFERKLRDGGQLLVSGPTENSLYRIGRLVAGFAGKADYHHTNIYALAENIQSHGFDLEKTVNLPVPFAPPLFRICAFRKPG